jgi:acetoin utilization deacetylase AcuC-like enzyme
MLLITSPKFEEHVTPPGHPERMERAHVFDAVAARWLEKGGRTAAPRPATRDELARVHAEPYLDALEATRGRAVMLDSDTFTSPESLDVAALAAGAAVQAMEHAIDDREAAFALVRPPGHHAERERAMGFCLYNSAAVAAAAALARGIERVAVVDIDVHHGNGTQWMFYGEPRVLYVSTHQFPFYPGTGAADEVGDGEGRGFTVNVPMEAGSRDADFALVYRELIVPVLAEYAPGVMIVSAGYDAHHDDPIASMRMTGAGYGAVVDEVVHAVPSAAIALVTEGGYDLAALAACLEASFAVIDRRGTSRIASAKDAGSGAAPRGERALSAARAVQAPYWRGI